MSSKSPAKVSTAKSNLPQKRARPKKSLVNASTAPCSNIFPSQLSSPTQSENVSVCQPSQQNAGNISTSSSVFSSPKKKQKLSSDQDEAMLFGSGPINLDHDVKPKAASPSAPITKQKGPSSSLFHSPPQLKPTQISTSRDLKTALNAGNKILQKDFSQAQKAQVLI